MVIFDASVPDVGRAMAIAKLAFQNSSPVTHFWNAGIDVGVPIMNYHMGDDLCTASFGRPTNPARTILGYGTLTPSNNHVKITAHEGAAPCTDGAVATFSGNQLDVWVEDNDPSCVGKDISFASYYGVPLDAIKQFSWSFSMTPMHTLTMTKGANRSNMLIASAVEGTPALNPNTQCGVEAATLVSQHAVNDAIVGTLSQIVPASQGQGHAVLGLTNTIPLSSLPDTITAKLLVGKNMETNVTTGGCCGDGMFGIVQF